MQLILPILDPTLYRQPLADRSLLEWALTSYPQSSSVLVLVPEAEADGPYWDALVRLGWLITAIPLGPQVRDPVTAVAQVSGRLLPDMEVVIGQPTTFLALSELGRAVTQFRTWQAVGGLVVEQGATGCPVTLDADWKVLDVRQEEPLGPWTTAGPYWCTKGAIWGQAVQRARSAGETVLPMVFNYLTGPVRAVPVNTLHHLDTEAAYAAVLHPGTQP